MNSNSNTSTNSKIVVRIMRLRVVPRAYPGLGCKSLQGVQKRGRSFQQTSTCCRSFSVFRAACSPCVLHFSHTSGEFRKLRGPKCTGFWPFQQLYNMFSGIQSWNSVD